MHITILNPSYGFLSGGYRKYLETLIPLLKEDPRVTGLDVFVPKQAIEVLKMPDVPLHEWAASDMGNRSPWLEGKLAQTRPDVVFIPSARWVNCGAFPVVTMVRNMEPLAAAFRGNMLLDKVKNIARARMIHQVCKRSTRVIAVSHYVRDFIIDKWQLNSEKIGVVYHGIQEPNPENVQRPTTLPVSLGNEDFLFTAGSLRPARGLEDVIIALGILKKQGICPTLVVGGEPHPGTEFYPGQIRQLAQKQGVTEQIVWAGQLNAAEMAWCFGNCSAFVFTSRAEACPNTVLEALSYGCYNVSTDQPPMPEFFQEGAFYYKGEQASNLAQELTQALSAPPEIKAQKRAAALQHASQFSWQTTADNTITQLELAISHWAP